MSELLIPGYLRAAVINQRIYPPGSPIVENSVSQIVKALAPLLADEALTYTARQGRIYCKGAEISEASALAAHLDEHGIQSLTFQPGVTPAEVAQLVLLLSKKKFSDVTVTDWLAQQDVTRIQLDKVKVVEVLEGEMVVKQIDRLFESVRDFPGLLNSLRDSYEMIDKIPDERGKAKAQDHMARKMAAMDPALLRDMFDNELPKRVEDSGLKTQVLNAMTQEKIHDIFSDIGNWYRQIRESATSDFEAVENLNKLKSFLGKILQAPASKQVPFALYEELISQGLLEEVPEGIAKTSEEESLTARVGRLLEKPSPELLELPLRDQLPVTLKKLCDLGLDDLAERMLEKVLENFTTGAALMRQTALRIAHGFLEILWANRKDRLWTRITAAVKALADGERSPDVYREVADLHAMIIIHFVLHGKDDDAVALLATLRRHANEENPLSPKRPELAKEALRRIADNLIEVLVEDLLAPDVSKKEAAQTILAHLGEGAVPCFVRMIKKSPDLRHRRLAASALKYFGAAARADLAAEFHLGNSTDSLLNLLSVLDDFLSPDLVPRLEPFLHFPDATIRRRLIQILAKVGDPAAGRLLTAFLDDADEGSQIEAIRAAGETKNRDAVGKLVDLLKAGSTRRLEETCLALGQIAAPPALPALAEIIEPKSALFKKRAAVEETVRVRAAWAVAQLKTAEAREVLSRALKDPNLQIQTIARTALNAASV